MPVTVTVPADFAYLNVVSASLAALLERVTADESLIYNIQLAVQEACTNIVKHAYPPEQPGTITVLLRLANEELVIELCDKGGPFDPNVVTLPDLNEPQEGGYGLFLIHSLMDHVHYEHITTGNVWRLTKYLGDSV